MFSRVVGDFAQPEGPSCCLIYLKTGVTATFGTEKPVCDPHLDHASRNLSTLEETSPSGSGCRDIRWWAFVISAGGSHSLTHSRVIYVNVMIDMT